MNYSENSTYGRKVISKKKMHIYQNRFLIYSLIVLGIGIVIGIIFSSIFWSTKTKAAEPIQDIELIEDIQDYGTYDGKVFTKEASMDWSSGDLKFVSLDCDLDEELQEFIFYLSSAYNIDFTFVMAQMQKESSFQSNVVSSTGDYGLMQINEINHVWIQETLGITDLLEPEQNIRAGVFVLRKLFEKYEDPNKVLMAYNMGETGASRLWKKGIYETSYTKDIEQIQAKFNEQLKEKAGKEND